ncbi:hypothetical protein GQ43DRAFT_342459, partial [Delitschia confertaspora ATCC 74209]
RFQIIIKLGFGLISTVWLCRDLKENRYLTLKIRVWFAQQGYDLERPNTEILITQHLNRTSLEHPGKKRVRRAIGSFQIMGDYRTRLCVLLYEPLGM